MSTLSVDTIQGKTTGSKVDIAGHVVQVIYAQLDSNISTITLMEIAQ